MQRILPESWQRALRQCLDTCLPHRCLLCGKESDDTLCTACSGDIGRLPTGCAQCGETSPANTLCGHCLAAPPHFDATRAPFLYAFPLDRLIQAYKYGGELALAPWFANKMAQAIGTLPFDRILPMPLHPGRLRERGFNQSAELARLLAKKCQTRLDLDACQRRRATSVQADLPHKERAANVRGAFECTRSFAGEHLLLIDDVMTTGTTASECARTLKLHGAASVTVAVIARALRG